MKNLFLFICTQIILTSAVFAQAPKDERHKERKAKMEAMKIGFLTDELKLSSEEAQKFWPVYNEYHAAIKTLKKSRKPAKDPLEMTDAEANEQLNSNIAMKTEKLELDKRYIEAFKKVLSPQKIIKLEMAERKFKKELVRKIRKPGEGKQGPKNRE